MCIGPPGDSRNGCNLEPTWDNFGNIFLSFWAASPTHSSTRQPTQPSTNETFNQPSLQTTKPSTNQVFNQPSLQPTKPSTNPPSNQSLFTMITSTNFGMSTHVGPPWPLTAPSKTYKNLMFLQGLARSGFQGHFFKKFFALRGPRAPQGEFEAGILTPPMHF